MVSGKRASEKEKEYIADNQATISFCQIAKNLGELYSIDNGGSRERQFVKHWSRKLKDEKQD